MITMIAISTPEMLGAAAAVAALIGAFCGAVFFFTKTLDARLSDKSVLDAIAAKLRPELIFSDMGAITVDRGGGAFLADKKIEIITNTDKTPSVIIVHLNRHLDLPPILTPMNPDVVYITTHRQAGNDWRFDLEYSMTTQDEHPYRRYYRLEFLG